VGDILQIIADCGCDTYQYVIPSEGTNQWVDNLAIPTDAPNKPLAEAFIDYILDPVVGASISNYTAYGSPNQAAIDQKLIDPALLDDVRLYPPEDIRAKLFSIKPLPDADQLYNDAWDEIKISLGK
jgi:spermidine/putrescine transport system substrate-binding protein